METRKDSYRLVILGMLFLILFCFPIPVNSLSVLFSEIKEQIPLTTADAGRIMSMVSLAAFLFFALGGALADKIGPRLALGGVSMLGAVAGGVRAFAHSANDLMACMFFVGGAVALFYPLIPKVIGSWFAPHDFGKANGAASFVLYFSSALGVATAANYLSPAFGGWRAFFIAWGIVTAIATIPWFLFYREGPYLASNPGPSPSFRENYKQHSQSARPQSHKPDHGKCHGGQRRGNSSDNSGGDRQTLFR